MKLWLMAGILALYPHPNHSICPQTCICMWKSGKETVECVNKNLPDIPPDLEASTQVLDFRGNALSELKNDTFIQLGITNLQKVYLQKCKIKTIEPFAMKKLTNLVELDLSSNQLQEISLDVWAHTRSLMRLNLSGNPISNLSDGSFRKLEFLVHLELSHCSIRTIKPGAFSGLASLEWLRLDGNFLSTIPAHNLFPPTLKGISLHDNPWHCDCNLIEFHSWLIISGVPRADEPRCLFPERLKGRTVPSLGGEVLACPPVVEPAVGMQLESELGRNLTIECTVTGSPDVWITWWQEQRLIANGTRLTSTWQSPAIQVFETPLENGQKLSELLIVDIKFEDSGSYLCRGHNEAGWAGANFSLTVLKRKSESGTQEIQDSRQMFQVEYILGFGAAVVIVLTIVIVLILYLILQCRQRRRDMRLRKLICDSRSSGSFADRATVDYIVPGEMELMSAVRSVSCNSSMSKCKQGEDDEYGPGGSREQPPIIDSLFVKNSGGSGGQGDCPPPPPPPPPPPGGNLTSGLSCSNPDLVQDTKLWDRPSQKMNNGTDPNSYRGGMNGYIPNGAGGFPPHQYCPPFTYYRQAFQAPHLENQYLDGQVYPVSGYLPHHMYPLPPHARHQFGKQSLGVSGVGDQNETVLNANSLSGDGQPFYPGCDGSFLIWPTGVSPPFQYFHTQYHIPPLPEQPRHRSDCPRSRTQHGYQNKTEVEIHEGVSHGGHHEGLPLPGHHHHYLANPLHADSDSLPQQNSQGYGYYLGGSARVPGLVPRAPPPYIPPPSHTPTWSLEDEEMKYGPFSDGEAETMRRPSRPNGRRASQQARGAGDRHLVPPHYATMGRGGVANLWGPAQSTAFQHKKGDVRYTSQPLLNSRSHEYLDHMLVRPSSRSDFLTPLSIKTSITFPRRPNNASTPGTVGGGGGYHQYPSSTVKLSTGAGSRRNSGSVIVNANNTGMSANNINSSPLRSANADRETEDDSPSSQQPPPPPQERGIPVSSGGGGSYVDESPVGGNGELPDLARHPLSYTTAPPPAASGSNYRPYYHYAGRPAWPPQSRLVPQTGDGMAYGTSAAACYAYATRQHQNEYANTMAANDNSGNADGVHGGTGGGLHITPNFQHQPGRRQMNGAPCGVYVGDNPDDYPYGRSYSVGDINWSREGMDERSAGGRNITGWEGVPSTVNGWDKGESSSLDTWDQVPSSTVLSPAGGIGIGIGGSATLPHARSTVNASLSSNSSYDFDNTTNQLPGVGTGITNNSSSSNTLQLVINGARRQRRGVASTGAAVTTNGILSTGSKRNSIVRRTTTGAVKVDLTCADKSIRRPDSAPDLISVDSNTIERSTGSRLMKSASVRNRDRSSSSDRLGVSPGARKQVVFAGIDDEGEEDDNSSGRGAASDSDTEVAAKRLEDNETGCDRDDSEDVWVKRPEVGAKKEDDIPVTGVVIAKPNPNLSYPAP